MPSSSRQDPHRSGDRTLTLRGPDWVVASLSHLLGFHPQDSIVALWLGGGEVRLVQRIDLPTTTAPRSGDVAAVRGAVLHSIGLTRADSVVLCVVGDRGSDPDLPGGALIADLCRAVQGSGCTVLDALLVEQGPDSAIRWWSYLCERSCCPPEGRCVPDEVTTTVGAEFAWEGVAVQPSRDAVAAEFVGDAERRAAVAACLDEAPWDAIPEDLEEWRDHAIADLQDLLGLGDAESTDGSADHDSANPDGVSPWRAAAALRALGDVRVRDTVLWHLVRAPSRRRSLTAATALLRAAPEGSIAPIATCTAIAAWVSGDGVRARFAVERALDDRPGYGLASLLDSALDAGMSGSDWRAAMASLTEAQCRGRVEVHDAAGL